MSSTAHLVLLDQHADWEVGHLAVELRTGRFTGRPFDVVTVGRTLEPVTTMGGLRVLPDVRLESVDPRASDVLVLAGSTLWDTEPAEAAPAAELARRFVDAGVPVAAICGATAGLARAGLLDDRAHTSAAPEYLAATGYPGGAHYVEARAVVGDGVVTAGPASPVPFARRTLELLGLVSEETGEAYEAVFDREDATAYPALMAAAA